MKQSQIGTNFIKDQLDLQLNYELVRNKSTDFTRKRKIGPKELIIYNMNKKGLSSKMEEYQFFKITGYENISTPGMLKQREKLNPNIFVYLNDGLLNVYYKDCKDEMKLYKGYLLTATDGSEFEIPNTKVSKESFGSTTSGSRKSETTARAKVSIVLDILNKFVLDVCIAKHRTNDMKLSKIHRENIKLKFSNYKIINIKDRGYVSLEDMYYSSNTNNISLFGYNMNDIFKYGNSFEYKNGIYTLIDTKEFWNWPDNYNQINNNHYTCFNATGECEQIYYIYYTTSSNAFYITLSDGKNVNDAINEMLYADDVNQTNSIIKNKLDTWYENNIVNILDSKNILYSSYLENTIWCNNRDATNLNESGWNPTGGDTAKGLIFNAYSLNCNNKLDQFTLKAEAGGTEGYGNNALDYPVGLIDGKEIALVGNYSYLKSGNSYWLLSIYNFTGTNVASLRYTAAGQGHGQTISYSDGVRPSVSLSNKVEITGGDGSVTLPYQVELSS